MHIFKHINIILNNMLKKSTFGYQTLEIKG